MNGSIDPWDDYFYDFSGPFTCLDPALPAGGSCTVTITFAPRSRSASPGR